MICVEIRAGLRGLEFQPAATDGDVAQYATVEFARSTPLCAGEKVRVPLGSQGNVLRELVGEPQLVETIKLARARHEYRYRLHGRIASNPVKQ